MNFELVIRSIIGPAGIDIRPLAYAVELTGRLLFDEKVAIDDIKVTKDVYLDVARRLGKKRGAVSRRIERLANYCWDKGDRDRLEQIIGRRLRCCPPPREMLVYLAYYACLGVPYYKAIEREPALMF